MNEISGQKPDTLLRKKPIDSSKISPQGMVSTTTQMTTPKATTNFASSKLGNISSGKKNYHPKENQKYFASNSKNSKQVDWNSKTSSRVKLGLIDRKISEPRLIQARTFESSPLKMVQSQSTSRKLMATDKKSPNEINSPDSLSKNKPYSSIISLSKQSKSHQKPIMKRKPLIKHQSTKIFEIQLDQQSDDDIIMEAEDEHEPVITGVNMNNKKRRTALERKSKVSLSS